MPLTIVASEVGGRIGVSVRMAGGRIQAVGRDVIPLSGDEVVDAAGGALLPGLHDHHLHLMSWAARASSIDVRHEPGPALRRATRNQRPGEWLRGWGYDEQAAGELDAARLDAWLGPAQATPTRVQHRAGHQWVLNRAAIRALEQAGARLSQAERATGVLYESDARLREHLRTVAPDLAPVSGQLLRFGVTSVTDATVDNDEQAVAALAAACTGGRLHQRVTAMGSARRGFLPGRVETGPLKIVLADGDLPSLPALRERIANARPQCVAIHAVTVEALVLAAVALDGLARAGDRLEHASVAPPDVLALVARLPVTVVTQPGFIAEHGDRYLRAVPAGDHPWLYRLRGWLEAGVELRAGSDAPFGDPDPWRAMRAAVDRRTAAGAELSPDEALSPDQALALYAGPDRIAPGERADLCLLAAPWAEVRNDLSSGAVRLVIIDGSPVRPPRPSP